MSSSFILFLTSLVVTVPTGHSQIIFGQSDGFEGGSTANWSVGGFGTGPTVATGGPLGATDHFLRASADGFGSGGKLTVFNRSQWTGNFNAAGVTHINMDLKGLSSPANAALSIRIALKSGTAGGSPGYVSTTPFTLPIDGLWHHARFDLSAMTAVDGTPPALSTLLDNLPEVRLLHAPIADTARGVDIVAEFGVDNITAVPEPSAGVGVALVLAAFALHRRAQRPQ